MAKAKPQPVVEPTIEETTENEINTITDIPTESVEIVEEVVNPYTQGYPSRDLSTAL